MSGFRPIVVGNSPNTESENVLPPPREPFCCRSVAQLDPLFALHAEDHNNGSKEAGLKASVDVFCPSVSNTPDLLMLEPLQIVLLEQARSDLYKRVRVPKPDSYPPASMSGLVQTLSVHKSLNQTLRNQHEAKLHKLKRNRLLKIIFSGWRRPRRSGPWVHLQDSGRRPAAGRSEEVMCEGQRSCQMSVFLLLGSIFTSFFMASDP